MAITGTRVVTKAAVPAKLFDQWWLQVLNVFAPSPDLSKPENKITGTFVLVPMINATNEFDQEQAVRVNVADVWAKIQSGDQDWLNVFNAILIVAQKEARAQIAI